MSNPNIQQIIDKLNATTTGFIPNYMIITQNLCFDVDLFIPSMQLGIISEPINDISQDLNPNRPKNIAQQRALAAQSEGVGLIQLIDNSSEAILRFLLDHIYSTSQKPHIVGARECQLVETTQKHVNDFIDRWHIQKHAPSANTCLALQYDGQTIAAMQLGTPRFQTSEDTIEILRYCVSPHVFITGGFQRFITAIESMHLAKSITTYCHLNPMLRTNNIYIKSGFEPESTTPPDYVWISLHDGTALSRYQCQKTRLKQQGFDIAKSESQIMRSRGYVRVFGAGSLKYRKQLY